MMRLTYLSSECTAAEQTTLQEIYGMSQNSINEIKALIMDTVRKANSGHTGGAFSSLDFTYVLFRDFLN